MPTLSDTKKRSVLSLGEMVGLAEELRIDFGGTRKLDSDKLSIIYKSLRAVHLTAKGIATPIFTRKITEAQAAITLIKSKKDPLDIEKMIEKLIEHLKTALKLLGTITPQKKVA